MTTHLIRSSASDGKERLGRSFFASRLRVGLALFLAGVSLAVAALCLDSRYGPPTQLVFHLSAVLVLLFLVGLSPRALKCAIASVGEVFPRIWPGHPILTILVSGGTWLIGVLAGLHVFAGADSQFWLRWDQLPLVTFLILVELGAVAVAFWMFLLRALHPATVAEPAYRLGYGWPVVVFTAAVLLLAHGSFLIASVNADHRKPLQGLLILAVGARLLLSRGPRLPDPRGQSVEQHWYQFLVYPFRSSRLWLGLTLFLTGSSVCAATFLPGWLNEPPTPLGALAAFHLSAVLVLASVLGLACSALDCVLASAAAGEPYHTRWRRNGILAILDGATKWITCFWAGPWVFAVAGCLYWLRCGEPSLVDFLILAELGVVGVSYWIFLLLTVIEGARPRDLTPTAVIGMAHRLGWPGLAAVLTAALLVLAHGWFLTDAVEHLHRPFLQEFAGAEARAFDVDLQISAGPFRIVRGVPGDDNFSFVEVDGDQALQTPLRGLWILVIVWLSAAYFCIFFCRLLGVWCYRTRPAPAA